MYRYTYLCAHVLRPEKAVRCFSLLLSAYSLRRGFITKPDACHFGLAVELLSSQDPPVSNSQPWGYSHIWS